MITEHAQKVGMLGPDERFDVSYVDVVDRVTNLEGEVRNGNN